MINNKKLLSTTILLVGLLILFQGCTKTKNESNFYGKWTINDSETLEYLKNTEFWNEMGEKEQQMFPKLIKNIIMNMDITFTKEKMITNRKGTQSELSYELISKTDKEAVINVFAESQEIKMTIYFMNNQRIRFTSDATDDMNFFIWEKTE